VTLNATGRTMSTTPGKPRQSGIPTPGRASGIPTPGRSRSSSSANHYPALPSSDVEYMSRAFADAIKANDPAHHRPSRASDAHNAQLSQPPASLSGRRSVAGRPSSVASSSSAAGHTPYKVLVENSKTLTAVRSSSRQSDVSRRSSSRASRPFEVGDNVRIESLGYEGTLRFMGAIDGKSGMWAGVELSGGFSGKGKNNGTVNG
jgi:CAP-Gly domain-containing linker protein 1